MEGWWRGWQRVTSIRRGAADTGVWHRAGAAAGGEAALHARVERTLSGSDPDTGSRLSCLDAVRDSSLSRIVR